MYFIILMDEQFTVVDIADADVEFCDLEKFMSEEGWELSIISFTFKLILHLKATNLD